MKEYIFLETGQNLEEYYRKEGFVPQVEKEVDIAKIHEWVDLERDDYIPPDVVLDAYTPFNRVLKHLPLLRLQLMFQAIKGFEIGKRLRDSYVIYILLKYPFSKVYATIAALEAYYTRLYSVKNGEPYTPEGVEAYVRDAVRLIDNILEGGVAPNMTGQLKDALLTVFKYGLKAVDTEMLLQFLWAFDVEDEDFIDIMMVMDKAKNLFYAGDARERLANWLVDFVLTALQVWYARDTLKRSPIVKQVRRGFVVGEKGNWLWSAYHADSPEMVKRNKSVQFERDGVSICFAPFGLGMSSTFWEKYVKKLGKEKAGSLFMGNQFMAWNALSNLIDSDKKIEMKLLLHKDMNLDAYSGYNGKMILKPEIHGSWDDLRERYTTKAKMNKVTLKRLIQMSNQR